MILYLVMRIQSGNLLYDTVIERFPKQKAKLDALLFAQNELGEEKENG